MSNLERSIALDKITSKGVEFETIAAGEEIPQISDNNNRLIGVIVTGTTTTVGLIDKYDTELTFLNGMTANPVNIIPILPASVKTGATATITAVYGGN